MKLRTGLTISAALMLSVIGIQARSSWPEMPEWSIAIYGGWDNTQFGLFPSDLWGESRKLLKRVGKLAPRGIPLVLLYDGLQPGDSELVDLRTDKTLDDAGFVIDPKTHEVDYGDPDTLLKFIIWMHNTYPSRHFLLCFGHHYGWEGFNTDESSPGPKNMDIITMPEYHAAMLKARDAGVNIDVQLFEACSATMIETLYEYGKFSTYIVGNEDTIDFSDMAVRFPRALKGLKAKPDMTPEDTAKLLVRAYPLHTPAILTNQLMPLQYTLNPRAPSTRGELGLRKWSPTQFAFDGRRIPDVANAVDRLSSRLLEDISKNRPAVLRAQKQAQKYTLLPWYVDLYDWADRLEKLSDDPEVKELCRAVKTSAQNSVVAMLKLESDERRHGILILLPATAKRWKIEKVNEFDPSTSYHDHNFSIDTHWDEFLDALFGS